MKDFSLELALLSVLGFMYVLTVLPNIAKIMFGIIVLWSLMVALIYQQDYAPKPVVDKRGRVHGG